MITTLCSEEYLCCITRYKGSSVCFTSSSTQGILEQPRQFVWNKTVDLHEASAEAWWESDNFWYNYLEMTKIWNDQLHARSCLISWGWSWERWGPTRFVFKFEGPMDGGMKRLGGPPVGHLWRDLKLWVPMQQPRNLKDLESFFKEEWVKIPSWWPITVNVLPLCLPSFSTNYYVMFCWESNTYLAQWDANDFFIS